MLGLAVDPAFPEEPWIYAYFSDLRDGMNRLVRMRLEGDRVGKPETVFDAIATTSIHNGGDLAFGEDRTVFLVTGDGAEASRSQDPDDPHGKVLRFEPDGSIPGDNPTPGSPVFALGIRNSFGLCVDPTSGTVWETENGPTSWDEVNEIRAGANSDQPDRRGARGEQGEGVVSGRGDGEHPAARRGKERRAQRLRVLPYVGVADEVEPGAVFDAVRHGLIEGGVYSLAVVKRRGGPAWPPWVGGGPRRG